MPVVLASMSVNCAIVAASVTVTAPVCTVIVPSNAASKTAAVPDNAPSTSLRVIEPVLASLIVFNCPAVGSSVIITVPVCVVTVPAKASAKSDAVPKNESVVTFKVISPVVKSLIVFNCVTLTLPVTVTATEPET